MPYPAYRRRSWKRSWRTISWWVRTHSPRDTPSQTMAQTNSILAVNTSQCVPTRAFLTAIPPRIYPACIETVPSHRPTTAVQLHKLAFALHSASALGPLVRRLRFEARCAMLLDYVVEFTPNIHTLHISFDFQPEMWDLRSLLLTGVVWSRRR